MLNIKQKIILKSHLFISVLIVIPISIVYGFKPSLQFNINLNTIYEQHFFKAIMGLYIGFSILWIIGIFKTKFLKPAIVSNLIFMLGLGSGRLLSLVIDGEPTTLYLYGTFAELALGVYGIWALSRYKM